MYRKLIVATVAALAVFGAACTNGNHSGTIGDQAAQASKARASAYAKANALYPQPEMKNFPLRKALVDLTVAQDKVNHPWYIYIQAQATGQIIAYYVGKTAPQNVCNTLSSTQAVTDDPNAESGSSSLLLTAPSLNGYFAGGAGAAGSCATYFFQDASTGANVELFGDAFIVMDQPLDLNVPRLRVSTSP